MPDMELIPNRYSDRSVLSRSSSSCSSSDPQSHPHSVPSIIASLTILLCLLQAHAAGSNQLTQDKRPGLICWTCSNKSSNDECNDWAPNAKCQRNQTLCKTIHRLDVATESSLSVTKFCTSFDECSVDRMGCRISSSSPSSSSGKITPQQQQQLVCESCCDSSYCNEAVPTNDTVAKTMSMAILSARSSATSMAQYCQHAMASPSWTTMLTTALTIVFIISQHLQPPSNR